MIANAKEIIAMRIAKEFHDGDVINLGYGVPTLASNYVPHDVHVILHSENGCIGLGHRPPMDEVDPDITDAGGLPATSVKFASYIDSALSFGIMRGGHLDLTVLGALQVDEHGNIANWMIPGKKVPGMGGAMDLLIGAKRVVVGMEHTAGGTPKLLKECTYPLTAKNVVDRVITEMGVFDITSKGIVLVEMNSMYTVEQVKEATEAELIIPDDLKIML
ncbi:MAG: 3-oxoacid CoA-transferase subunit B [Acutalibacteraceae bacterium]